MDVPSPRGPDDEFSGVHRFSVGLRQRYQPPTAEDPPLTGRVLSTSAAVTPGSGLTAGPALTARWSRPRSPGVPEPLPGPPVGERW
ncbi:hypothetical protein ACFFX0_17735 [Citricoccus parietis]|uniref:Uncharacterized protein n=1 Tax=Citricoccus parietis TaxID=592307 RepID=A0ABV5G3A1_9MICC